MDKTQKASLVEKFKNTFSQASIVIVVHYKGLSVAEISALRNALYDKNVGFNVVKNTLSRLSIEGSPYENSIKKFLSGPTAVVYSSDPVAAAKGIADFAKTNEKLIVVGGAMQKDVLVSAQIEELAKLPSLDELRAKIVGLISAPARNTASLIHTVVAGIPRVIQAKIDGEN
ncbi:MAG: 50S ribosomal protein L10 [Rickettsiales bacterium]